jgi:hypothetical protein
MALAFACASSLELAPHAFSDKANLVGSPFFSIGPGMLPIRARNDALRGLSPELTGGFKFMPSALAEALPLAFKPPSGFLPSLRCQAAVISFSQTLQALQSLQTLEMPWR